jgi:hypothetical protein
MWMPSRMAIFSLLSTVFCRKKRNNFHILMETFQKMGGLPRPHLSISPLPAIQLPGLAPFDWSSTRTPVVFFLQGGL